MARAYIDSERACSKTMCGAPVVTAVVIAAARMSSAGFKLRIDPPLVTTIRGRHTFAVFFFMLAGVAIGSAGAATQGFARNMRVSRIYMQRTWPSRRGMTRPGAAEVRGHQTQSLEEVAQRAIVL